jgi:hypothetical protein
MYIIYIKMLLFLIHIGCYSYYNDNCYNYYYKLLLLLLLLELLFTDISTNINVKMLKVITSVHELNHLLVFMD